MILKKVGNERMLEMSRIGAIAFTFAMNDPDQKNPTQDEDIEQKLCQSEHWAMVDETTDRLMGGMILMEYQTRIGDNWLPLSGVGGVATLPEYRHLGVIRRVFSKVLPMMYEHGIALSGLYPFSHAFYRKFGYETFGGQNITNVGLEQLHGFKHPDEVRMIDDSRDMLSARAIYERFAQIRDLSMRRHFDSQWNKIMGGDAYKERVYKYLLLRRKGDELEPCAYIVFSPDDSNGGNRIAAAREAAYVDGDAFHRLLGFMSTFFPHYRRLRIALPGDIDLGAICPDPYDVRTEMNYGYMLRAVNARVMLESQPLSPALRALAEVRPLTFSLALTDEMIPQNTGRYDVTITGEGIKCAQSEYGDADMSMNINTFSQLTTGSISLSEAYARDDFEMNAPCPAAQMLFLRRPQYIVDHY